VIRVLIVDDSAVVRKILTEELSKFADIEVVAKPGSTYSTPDVSRHQIKAIRAASVARIPKQQEARESPVACLPSQLQTTHKVLAIWYR